MKKLSEFFKKLWTKFKSFNKKIRIMIIVAAVAVLVALISLVVYSTSTKYSVLFSNLDSTDANTIISKLSDEKVSYKVEGDSILVPSDKKDELRLDLSSSLTSGSTGYELMDNSSSFGMTDEEFAIKKVRMVQGELEKTIKSLDAVESARVHITQAENSVFVKNKQEGKAAVILQLKSGKTITKDQVKSIVAMVSAATEDIPQENVQVIDSNMNLLSEGLNYDSEDGTVSSDTIQQNKDLEEQSGQKYADAIVKLLEPVVGKNKVSANVNVDLDFDSKKTTTKTIDPNKVIVSQQTSKETSTSGGGAIGGSTVDNNLSNSIAEDENTNVVSNKEEQTTNYDTGSSESTVISSPGEIKRMTASIFVNDGTLDEDTRDQLEKAVASAIGIDTSRGDEISLIGMDFDTEADEEAKAQIDAFNNEVAAAKRNKIIMYCAIGGIIAAAIITAIVLFARKRRAEEEDEDEDDNLLDVVIDDTAQYKPIELDIENPQTKIENEIKNYAKEKPDQVADIVKSWLSENER